MNNWKLVIIGLLLLGIVLLTLYGRVLDCTIGARFGFYLLHSTEEIKGACRGLLYPFQFLL